MSTSIKSATLEELKPHQLTKVKGRKPTYHDIEVWEEECSKIATRIKNHTIKGGRQLGFLAIVISQEEYRLEIEDEDFEYEEPTEPEEYNTEITGEEEEHDKARLEAEHKRRQGDYERYLALTEHLIDQLVESMDETWLLPLRKPRSGYATRTIKEIFNHLKAAAAKLTAKEKQLLRAQINNLEWNRTDHITQYFTDLEDLQIKIEGWIPGLDTTEDAIDAATVQMKESGMFDHKFMRDWERKAPLEKTWVALKEYFTEEYEAIVQYDEPTTKTFESINNIAEGMLEEGRINNEQLQQMATSFRGATDVASEVMSRLKTALEEIKTLNKTVATLTQTNKQLVEAIAAMGGKQPEQKSGGTSSGKCPHCYNFHKMPFEEHCFKLNEDKRPPGWGKRNEKKEG
jgi:hypothetical protein